MRRLTSLQVFWVAALLVSASSRVHGQGTTDEFFIVSSINPSKMQVIAKRPTEVTQVIFVDADTKYFDRAGGAISLNDLRAGDTVFIHEKRDAKHSVATEIRKGPMTLNELRKRYLSATK